MTQIRCIDTKTGVTKYLSEHLTKDAKLMRAYNLEVQEVEKVKPIELIKEVTEPLIEPTIVQIQIEQPEEKIKVKQTRKKRK